MRWIEGPPLPALADGPVAWLFRDDDDAAVRAASRAGAAPSDLADAALARADGGAPRLLRRRVLRALAAEFHGLHPQEVVFRRDPRGAVQVARPAGLHVGAAGRLGWSAVALGLRPVGVDVEETSALPGPDLHAWLLREALAKAHGLGLDDGTSLPAPRPATFHSRGPVTACALVIDGSATG